MNTNDDFLNYLLFFVWDYNWLFYKRLLFMEICKFSSKSTITISLPNCIYFSFLRRINLWDTYGIIGAFNDFSVIGIETLFF
jgi:hypothetical protein